MTFNAKKSKVLVSWRKTYEEAKWRLSDRDSKGDNINVFISEATEYKYLGATIRARGKIFTPAIKSAITKAKTLGASATTCYLL